MRLGKLGLLQITCLHWGCRSKSVPPVEASPEVRDHHPLRSIAEPMPLNDIGNGDVVDGVYLDSSQLFSVVVPDDWEVVSGSQFGELRVTMEHSIHNYSVQIWQLKGTHYRPTVREDCVWSFIDKGLYTDWSMSRPTNVATCVSNDPNEELVFLFLRHWKGYTWYLEGHVDVDVLVEGERSTREVIQSIQWIDGESSQR